MTELADTLDRPARLAPGVGGPRLARRRSLPRGAEAAFLFALVLGAWQLGTALVRQEGNALLPSPAVTARALWASLPELLRGTWSSLLILVPGWTLAVVLGIAIGLVVGTTGWLRRAFFPFARVAAP